MLKNRIKEERERLGFTQPSFGDVAKVGKTTVINWEKGSSSPTAEQLSVLNTAGVDTNYIVTGVRHNSIEIAAQNVGEQLNKVVQFDFKDYSGMTDKLNDEQGALLQEHLSYYVTLPEEDQEQIREITKKLYSYVNLVNSITRKRRKPQGTFIEKEENEFKQAEHKERETK